MKLVTRKELRTIYGIPYSATHLDRMIAAGVFPAKLKLQAFRGGRIVWLARDIEDWIEQRIQPRREALK